jgi:hypothetical protein
MDHVLKGGAFAVLAVDNSTATDHPTGTWVPPKGSSSAAPPAGANQTSAADGNQTGAGANQSAAAA